MCLLQQLQLLLLLLSLSVHLADSVIGCLSNLKHCETSEAAEKQNAYFVSKTLAVLVSSSFPCPISSSTLTTESKVLAIVLTARCLELHRVSDKL